MSPSRSRQPFDLQMRKLRRPKWALGLAEDHKARSLRYNQSSTVSPGNLWHAVKWPHKVQASDLSPSHLVCNARPLATHQSKTSRHITLGCILCLYCVWNGLADARSCRKAGKFHTCPSLSLSFPRGRRVISIAEQEKEGF